MEMPEQEELMGGGNFLGVAGSFHLQVTHVDEQPVSNEGKAIDGFKVEFSVLGGPEAGKKTDLIFWNPKSTGKDGGLWARKKQGAFLVASGLVDESKCGQQVNVELAHATNRQVVAELEFGEEGAKGRKFLQLAWANIYHVDDPRASGVAKDAKALLMLPAALRRTADSFKPKSAANGQGSAPPPAGQASDIDPGDI
jgi:hypothetical protein